ncbi:MAG: ATP-binding protein [Syntrophotalea acetylenica]|jgi:two-component system nitrogen regulation sensor histidine kinase GlnL|uniref:histidine kinase n=1 Tax=Syntrophotalea acetylenica TaxID=29542 RepID=A0A1L3GCC4_SYNAC|nr:ATP-binding protein [Syntrophotalea acetylenica]APG23601.1 PAS domain-containing sensor histidine kinase [Syntrophotalea acetylenica]APG44178.1 PAS domain-containing sensor histidine kinase [Syntrophotalea acetylenica]MDD4458055.1 ATP-binding protein [Syntrophotalea acetylenica]MDY0261146.1 ATP-binding protein [Syntrophotalea acetylenica]
MKNREPKDRALYMRVLENMEEAVVAIDNDERIVLFNPAAQICTGYSERQALKRLLGDLFGSSADLLRLVRSALSSGRSITSHEDIMLSRSGATPLPVGVSASPLFNDDGEQEGAVLILRDHSQIRELEETVRQADRLAMLGTLAAGLAHEIKNPLGGIKGAAQLLNLELPPENPLREYTRVMTREVNRVNDLIEELLDLTRPRPTQFGEVNLSRILADQVLLQKQSHPDKQISYQLQLDPSIPTIRGDEALLSRLFLNLLKNAGEAIESKGLITVTSRIAGQYLFNKPGERPVPMVTVEIQDNGPGIPEDQIDRIFTPFFTTKTRGCGLGLAICQKIINEHQGSLRVNSRPDQGTTFTISLPLKRG